MRPHRTHLDTASCAFIPTAPMFCKRLCELVAFSEGESAKAAFEKSVLRQVALLPAKRQSPKSLILFQGIDASGFHPTQAKPSRMAMQGNSLISATTIRTRPRQSVGAKNDPLYGWLIYGAECADRLIRLHYSQYSSGLSGGRLCLNFRRLA